MEICESCNDLCIKYRRFNEKYKLKLSPSIKTFVNNFGFTSNTQVKIEDFCFWIGKIVEYIDYVNYVDKRKTIAELYEDITNGKYNKEQSCCFINLVDNLGLRKSKNMIILLKVRILTVKNSLLQKKYESIGEYIKNIDYDRNYTSSESEEENINFKIFEPRKIHIKINRRTGTNITPLQNSKFTILKKEK